MPPSQPLRAHCAQLSRSTMRRRHARWSLRVSEASNVFSHSPRSTPSREAHASTAPPQAFGPARAASAATRRLRRRDQRWRSSSTPRAPPPRRCVTRCASASGWGSMRRRRRWSSTPSAPPSMLSTVLDTRSTRSASPRSKSWHRGTHPPSHLHRNLQRFSPPCPLSSPSKNLQQLPSPPWPCPFLAPCSQECPPRKAAALPVPDVHQL